MPCPAPPQTIFVEEEFGDFNEKAYLDVRNFEEVWDWTKGSVAAPVWRGQSRTRCSTRSPCAPTRLAGPSLAACV